MSAILKFDFQKREQLRFSEVNNLNYTKKDPILHVATTVSLKQGETRTSHGPIPHSLNRLSLLDSRRDGGNSFRSEMVRGKKLNLYTLVDGRMTLAG